MCQLQFASYNNKETNEQTNSRTSTLYTLLLRTQISSLLLVRRVSLFSSNAQQLSYWLLTNQNPQGSLFINPNSFTYSFHWKCLLETVFIICNVNDNSSVQHLVSFWGWLSMINWCPQFNFTVGCTNVYSNTWSQMCRTVTLPNANSRIWKMSNICLFCWHTWTPWVLVSCYGDAFRYTLSRC